MQYFVTEWLNVFEKVKIGISNAKLGNLVVQFYSRNSVAVGVVVQGWSMHDKNAR